MWPNILKNQYKSAISIRKKKLNLINLIRCQSLSYLSFRPENDFCARREKYLFLKEPKVLIYQSFCKGNKKCLYPPIRESKVSSCLLDINSVIFHINTNIFDPKSIHNHDFSEQMKMQLKGKEVKFSSLLNFKIIDHINLALICSYVSVSLRKENPLSGEMTKMHFSQLPLTANVKKILCPSLYPLKVMFKRIWSIQSRKYQMKQKVSNY